MTRHLLVMAVGALVAGGCAGDVANRYYADETYPPRKTRDVEVLSEAPQRPYEVIADFQSRNEGPRALRRKAARIGAHAVIVTKLGGTYGDSEDWAEQRSWWTKRKYTRITGTAIRYTDVEE
ncbi:MAG: hypothetical protein ACOC7R_03940 [Planctomycetota bacterium]